MIKVIDKSLNIWKENRVVYSKKTIMKKTNFLLLCTSLIGLMTSCVSAGSSSKEVSSLEPSSTPSSMVPEKTLDEMLSDLKGRNITYHSDYQIYYYPVGKPAEKKVIEHYDVQTKFEESAYESSAYLISNNEKQLALYVHYEKGADGDVVEKYVDLQNEVKSRPVMDINEQTFKWEESVYVNQISKLVSNDFKNENSHYVYSGDLNNIPMTIVHGAAPVSNFDLESFTIEVKDNQIDKLVFVEKEADDVYDGSMYGRTISVAIEDVGKTEIKPVSAKAVSAENDALGVALEELRNASSYTTKLSVVVENQELPMQTVKLTEKDAVISTDPSFGGTVAGVHTEGESLYVFEQKQDQLVGTLVGASSDFAYLKPGFSFSKDIFEFAGEKDAIRNYEVGANYIDVLDDIVFLGEYSQAYAQTEENITFKVKDNHLEEVSFPTILQDNQGMALLASLRIQYSDINTTTIEPTYWDNFVVNETVLGEMLTWDASELEFNFELTSDGATTELMTPALVFDLCLPDSSIIPALIPSGTTYSVYGNYSAEDQCVYLDIEVENAYTDEVLEQINIALLDKGYTYDDSAMVDLGIESYTLGDVTISIMGMDGTLIVSFELPAGEFAAA